VPGGAQRFACLVGHSVSRAWAQAVRRISGRSAPESLFHTLRVQPQDWQDDVLDVLLDTIQLGSRWNLLVIFLVREKFRNPFDVGQERLNRQLWLRAAVVPNFVLLAASEFPREKKMCGGKMGKCLEYLCLIASTRAQHSLLLENSFRRFKQGAFFSPVSALAAECKWSKRRASRRDARETTPRFRGKGKQGSRVDAASTSLVGFDKAVRSPKTTCSTPFHGNMRWAVGR
jgi:hypothetical protein